MKKKTLKKMVCVSGLLFMTFPAWSAVPSKLLPDDGTRHRAPVAVVPAGGVAATADLEVMAAAVTAAATADLEAMAAAVTVATVMVMVARAETAMVMAVKAETAADRAAVRSHKIRSRSKPGLALIPGPSCSPRSSFRFGPRPELRPGPRPKPQPKLKLRCKASPEPSPKPRPNPWYDRAMPTARLTTRTVHKIN